MKAFPVSDFQKYLSDCFYSSLISFFKLKYQFLEGTISNIIVAMQLHVNLQELNVIFCNVNVISVHLSHVPVHPVC